MSTIASPRDPSAPFPRRANSAIITPTSSSRPSLDLPSASSSPTPNPPSTTTHSKRANRTALREYYNLRATTTATNPPQTPTVEITPAGLTGSASPPSELDSPTFHAQTYLSHLLSTSSLADLLRTYTTVLGELRALDAERKALVYDNYSKLIGATETIRRMRATAQAQGVVENGGREEDLGRVVEGVYEVARGLREGLRREVDQQRGDAGGRGRDRGREVVREVVQVPGRVRKLVGEGRVEEARREWEVPRRLLVRWREKGVGGEEVGRLIEEGDSALRGDEVGEPGVSVDGSG